MLRQPLEDSPRNNRSGQVLYLLLAPGQFDSKNLTITWVEGQPGSEQPMHAHPENEQVYVVVQGCGLMKVGTDSEEVGPGDMVLVPPNTDHAIKNTGGETLVYVSATSPPFAMPESRSPFGYRAAP